MADPVRCVLTLPLHTEPWQEHIIEKRFAIIEHLKNQLIAKELRRLKDVQRRKEYRQLEAQIQAAPKEQQKELWKQRNKLLRDYGFSEYAFKDDMAGKRSAMQKHFVEHIATQIAHKAASDVWRSFDKYLFRNGKMVHFHKRGTLNSVACQSAGDGMTYRDGLFIWKGGRKAHHKQIVLTIPVAKPDTDYEREMLNKRIANMRIVRKWVKRRYKYYLQLTLEGAPVQKHRPVGVGRVGIDIGTQTAAIVSERSVRLLELASQIQDNYAREQVLKRRMDRSRRYSNPQNYNPDGTIHRPNRGRLHWTYSKHYQQLAGQVRELERKNADIRKYQHTCLANEVLSMGNEIYVENMNFAGLQHRAKETKKGPTGRFLKKRRFGKSLANRAPATFLSILQYKAKQVGAEYQTVKTQDFKASQFDHTSGEYHRAQLNQRWKHLSNGDTVQRDLYSAFLLMNSQGDLSHTDSTLCLSSYETFKQLHDMEVERIRASQSKYPASFGIA